MGSKALRPGWVGALRISIRCRQKTQRLQVPEAGSILDRCAALFDRVGLKLPLQRLDIRKLPAEAFT